MLDLIFRRSKKTQPKDYGALDVISELSDLGCVITSAGEQKIYEIFQSVNNKIKQEKQDAWNKVSELDAILRYVAEGKISTP